MADRDKVRGFFNGYPLLGAFIASDRSFLTVWHFNHLQPRLWLQLQDELKRYKAQLDAIGIDPLLAYESLQLWEMDDGLSDRGKSLLQKIEYPTAYF